METPATPPRPAQPLGSPKQYKPEGKDYIVDVTVKQFPCVKRAGRSFTSVNGNVFNLPERFAITQSLGSGSYCTVVAANDRETGEEVALKKCSYVFARQLDGKRLLREVKLLRGLRHKNILPLRDILVPMENDFCDLYFVTEKMDTDLYHFQRKQAMPEQEAKRVLYQVLKALQFIHSAHVLHRDMKPDNILLRLDDGAVKICDFNLSRGETDGRHTMTTNVATRFYRAPELLLGLSTYDSAVDIWSVGCIFAEMLTGVTLFDGTTDIDMLAIWARKLGLDENTPTDWLSHSPLKDTMIGALKKGDGQERLGDDFADTVSPEALDFIRHILKFTPRERPSAAALLQHPYLKDYFQSDAVKPSSRVFKWKYDDEQPSVAMMRDLFWKEICQLHPEAERERREA
eukprot:NODE_387_length_1557_cov_99.578322_g355_i0.p1 GENE.NODE_387_length_1557_cov_99.578322_g355_i0~~NODE_387_length_1557_cov_99.578322_g355_i0.p1  ORF type:complete len:402 (+),score=60.69 NODE_387_length_1557_cov_99.578322_g355_i0:167-1372(+)